MSNRTSFARPEDSFWQARCKIVRFVVLTATLFSIGFLCLAQKPWAIATNDHSEAYLLSHDVVRGLWFGFSGSAAIGILLLLFWKQWGTPIHPRDRISNPSVEYMGLPLFLALLATTVVLGGYVRWNIATSSLWWEELNSISKTPTIYQEDTDKEKPQNDWVNTLWHYPDPLDQPPLAIATKISQSLWRHWTESPKHKFNELAIRAPTYAAGLGSILLIGLLVRRWGFSFGAIGAALFLAMHPWHIRYGTEARTQGLMLLWVLLGCLWLTNAIADNRGRWRYWFLLGLNQLLIAWTLPEGFCYAIGFALCGALVIRSQWVNLTDRSAAIRRLTAVNTMAVMVFLPLFMPNILQMMRWENFTDPHLSILPNFNNAIGQLVFGMDISRSNDSLSADIPTLAQEFKSGSIAGCLTVFLVLAGLLFGALRIWINRRGAAIMLIALLGFAILSTILSKISNQHYYHRFVVFSLVPFLILLGTGLSGIACVTKPKNTFAVLGTIVAVGLYLYIAREPRKRLQLLPYAPYKDVAEHLEMRAEKGEKMHVVCYGFGGRMMRVYYPIARLAKNRTELLAEIEKSKSSDSSLVVVLGYAQLNRESLTHGDGVKILESKGKFHRSRKFLGLDPLFQFDVIRVVNSP